VRGIFGTWKQWRKGAWTNDPADPNYLNHHQTLRPPDEPIEQVFPATAKSGPFGPKQMGTVVFGANNIYWDPQSVEAVGVLAKLARLGLRQSPVAAPQVIPKDRAQISQGRPNRLTIQSPSVPTVTARTDGFVGPPAGLSAGDQLRNLRNMFRK
jgi:hypothetical protein